MKKQTTITPSTTKEKMEFLAYILLAHMFSLYIIINYYYTLNDQGKDGIFSLYIIILHVYGPFSL